jgi:hypothetical protein
MSSDRLEFLSTLVYEISIGGWCQLELHTYVFAS